MDTKTLKSVFTKARKDSISLCHKSPNSLKSTLFVQYVCDALIHLCPSNKEFHLFCQRINDEWCGKKPGEWLLDGVIAQVLEIEERKIRKPFRTNIEWAVESEASTRLEDFLDDFGKLMVVESKNKLYLNGYRSDTLEKYINYRDKRLKIATELLTNFHTKGNFYFGFWPSPAGNFWDEVTIENHIIEVYKWGEKAKCFSLI